MNRDRDEAFEDEEYRKRIEQERRDRAYEKADIVINLPAHASSPTGVQRELAELMACLQCGQTMRRGTQCNVCGAWCR